MNMVASPGEPAKTGPTDSLEFKAWFTDSKAVDSTGKPLVLYHGTNKEFSVFKAVAGPRSKMVGDWEGIHFTNDRAQAQSIAQSLARGEGGTARVVEAYLQAKNPVPFGTYRTKEQALAAGHDSRLTQNNVGLQEWTVFDPSQVKFATEYNTPAFLNWFGDSKVVDAEGKPLVVYHGTDEEFNDFQYGEFGFHFGNKEQAESRGEILMPVYLSIKNPIHFKTDFSTWDEDYIAPYLVRQKVITKAEAAQGDLQGLLMEKGYDGYIYPNGYEGGGISYAVFSPEQIKSAIGNNGEFSPKNPDIRFSVIAESSETPSIAPIVYTAQRSFAHALKPVKDAIYSELIEATDAGPFDGGCVVFADSLQSVIGGTVVVLTNKGGRGDHAAVELGGKLYDFDGPLAPMQFIARFEKNEHAEIAGYRPMEDHDLPDAPRGINGRLVSLLKQAFGMQEVSVQVSLKDSFDIPELQKQLAAVEAKFERLRVLKKYSDAEWDAVTKEAAPISHRLFELTGDHYGKPSVKKVKPSDAALEAQYASPDEVPADVRLWVLKNTSLLYSDATDAVRWSRIEDTLRDARYPSGDLTLYRAVADGDDIRPGDWVTTELEYAQDHLTKSLGGKGHILEETVDGRDVLVSPTGNAEEAIYAPRSLSGPVKTRPIASKTGQEATQEVASTGTGLRSALLQSTRQTRWGLVPDPIAESIASSKSFAGLENALKNRDIQELKPLSGGASSVVLDAGETVVRIGFGKAEPRPKIPELLQAIDCLNVGNTHFEILPKVDTTSLNEKDVQFVVDALRKRGYSWGDAGVDNIGRYKGQLVAIDPGGIALTPTNEAIATKGVQGLEAPVVGSAVADDGFVAIGKKHGIFFERDLASRVGGPNNAGLYDLIDNEDVVKTGIVGDYNALVELGAYLRGKGIIAETSASTPKTDPAIQLSTTAVGSVSEVLEVNRRIDRLPGLLNSAGTAYTFWKLAMTAISRAGGEPTDVDWQAVEDATIQEAVGKNKQTPQSVHQAISQVSPGALSISRQAAVLAAAQAVFEQQQARLNNDVGVSHGFGTT